MAFLFSYLIALQLAGAGLTVNDGKESKVLMQPETPRIRIRYLPPSLGFPPNTPIQQPQPLSN